MVETVECPPSKRPAPTTIDEIAEQLAAPPDRIGAGVAVFDQFAWSLFAAGVPVLRVTLHVGTLHPQFLGTTMTWWRDTGQSVQVKIRHEVARMSSSVKGNQPQQASRGNKDSGL